MKVYVVVEMFKGDKIPEIRGVYTDKAKAEEIKNIHRFAFIDAQNLIQTRAENEPKEVYVVYELLVCNVPRVVGVFKDENLAKGMAEGCEYPALVEKRILN